jgi:CDP-diacylglycerol--glycerol-3-phosphate 3-phosphatidyltransferase
MTLNIPTLLTLLRITFIPIIVASYVYEEGKYRDIAAYIFLLALITDYLDGVIARKFDQVTTFGTFLDPIADKLLVVVSVILLSSSHDSMFFLIPALIIVSREFLVIAIRQRLAEIKSTISMKVNTLGKVKTGFQMASLFFLLHTNIFFNLLNLHTLGLLLLFIAAVLTVVSFVYYVRNSWNDIVK